MVKLKTLPAKSYEADLICLRQCSVLGTRRHTQAKKWKSGSIHQEEYYPEYKNPRAILARGDLAKAILGPAFDQLNHLFFTLPETVKKLPASKRPAYIEERCSGPYYYVTDHTAFECSATREIQVNMEMRIYRQLLGPDMHKYLDILLETQYVKCGNGTALVPASRFSGEMNTSLGKIS